MIKVYNTGNTDFIDTASGVGVPAGGERKFATIQDAMAIPAIQEAILNGDLKTDGFAGSTIWVFDERDGYGSVDTDEWRTRPLNRMVSLPVGISSLSNDSFLLPTGEWSFSIHASGSGNVRLFDVTNSNVLVTSTDGDGIMTLYGYVAVPSPIYVRFDSYFTNEDVSAPKSSDADPDGTLYTFLAAKFVCVRC